MKPVYNRASERERILRDAVERIWTLPPPTESLLVYDEPGLIYEMFADKGHAVHHWNRWSRGHVAGQVVPDAVQASAAVRLIPKSKDALRYAGHVLASRLEPGARIYLCGANDEGIKSAVKSLATLFDEATTVGTKARCRVISAQRTTTSADGTLDVWWQSSTMNILGEHKQWFRLPGVFAKGQLDPATQLLIENLPKWQPGARILDFACGTGVIAQACRNIDPSAMISAIDADSLAIECTQRNVPSATTICGDAWHALPSQSFDLIVSNPPIHDGKSEDHGVLKQLIEHAPAYLNDAGRLIIVCQARIGVGHLLTRAFSNPLCLAETSQFQVWSSH